MIIEWLRLIDFSFVNQRASNHYCRISRVLLLLFQGSLIKSNIKKELDFKNLFFYAVQLKSMDLSPVQNHSLFAHFLRDLCQHHCFEAVQKIQEHPPTVFHLWRFSKDGV